MPDTEKAKTVPLRKRRKLLRQFLKEYDITLAEFGTHAGLSKGMLSMFVSGNRGLSPEAWTRVLVAMGNLVSEDNAKRQGEIAKRQAEEGADRAAGTAAKLGVPRGALHNALSGPPPTEQEMEEFRAILAVYRPENSRGYWVRFFVNGRIYEESADTESHGEAVDFVEKRVEEKLRESREQRKRQLVALENLGIDAPIITELIESFRREIAEKDEKFEALSRTLEKQNG